MRASVPFWLAFTGLALATTLCSVPALVGSWVYDDLPLAGDARYRGWHEVATTFGRNSAYYIGHPEGALDALATYRPLPMFTLLLTNTLFGPTPLPHHVLSLLIHLLVVGLLLRLARDGRSGRVPLGALYCAALFALHPALGEGYLWINGRSDPLAGVALAAAALSLRWQQSLPPGRGVIWPWVALLVVATAGLLSKSPFLPAVLALIVASVVARPAGQRRGGALVAVLAACCVLVGLGVQAWLSASSQPPASASKTLGWLLRWGVLWDLPQLLTLGAETLLLPAARPMRNLAWELAQPLSLSDHAVLLIGSGLLALLVWRRAFYGLVLLIGAAATLAPTVFVGAWPWQGFDRYLYLPACLLAIGGCSTRWDGPFATAGRRRSAVLLGIALCVYLGAQSFVTASFYASHDAFMLSIIERRPDDPSGYAFAANALEVRGEFDTAREALKRRPRHALPHAMGHKLAAAELRLGLKSLAAQTTESSYALRPDYPPNQLDAFALRLAQGRFDEALALARGLLSESPLCLGTLRQIDAALATGMVPPAASQALRRLRTAHAGRCRGYQPGQTRQGE